MQLLHLLRVTHPSTRGWTRKADLPPANDTQNLKLHRLATLFEDAVERFLDRDPNVPAGGAPEHIYFKPPGLPPTRAIVAETIPDAGKGKRYMVQVRIPERPGFSLEYRTSRRRIERVKPRLCHDPRWMRCIVESTGFKASEVRHCYIF